MLLRFVSIAIVAAACAWPVTGLAQPADNANTSGLGLAAVIEQSLVDAIARAEPSIVAISRSGPAQPTGPQTWLEDPFDGLRPTSDTPSTPPVVAAGVIIDATGLVLTEYLAVRQGDIHTVTTIDGAIHPATIRAADPRSGLAVLAIDAAKPSSNQATSSTPADDVAKFPAIQFGDAALLRKGQFVIAIGNPYGVVSDGQPTVSWGIITNLARKAPVHANLNNAPGPLSDHRTTLHHLGTLIQTDAKLGWSAGGGALINLRGQLVGLTTTLGLIAGHEQPAGYAIPINESMRRIIDTLQAGREVEYGMLGITFGDPQPTAGTSRRIVVNQVFPGSPAARAGLQSRDIVTRLNQQPIADIDTLQLAVSTLPPSTTATLEFNRGGRLATTPITLTKLAIAGEQIVTTKPKSWRGIRIDYATALEPTELLAAIESSAYDQEGCVLIAEVYPDSPAAKAGIRPGMFISHVGERRVTTPAEFHEAVQHASDERDLRLTQSIQSPSANTKPPASTPDNPKN